MDNNISLEYKKFKEGGIISFEYKEGKVHGNKNINIVFKKNALKIKTLEVCRLRDKLYKTIYDEGGNCITSRILRYPEKHSNETTYFEIKQDIKNILKCVF